MATDEDVLNSRLIRIARPPSIGSRMNQSSAGRLQSGASSVNTIVTSDGKVRRLWQPGDPWTSDYFFGGSEVT